jgi:hypothetical protein
VTTVEAESEKEKAVTEAPAESALTTAQPDKEQKSGVKIVKHFFFIADENKLECLSMSSMYSLVQYL